MEVQAGQRRRHGRGWEGEHGEGRILDEEFARVRFLTRMARGDQRRRRLLAVAPCSSC